MTLMLMLLLLVMVLAPHLGLLCQACYWCHINTGQRASVDDIVGGRRYAEADVRGSIAA